LTLCGGHPRIAGRGHCETSAPWELLRRGHITVHYGGGSRLKDDLGRTTLEEIGGQPEDWERLLRELRRRRNPLRGRAEVLLIGCGSQHYLALTAAWVCRDVLRIPAEAAPASEFLAFPHFYRPRRQRSLVVLVSRSGKTTEVVQACECAREMGLRTLFLGAVEDAPLVGAADESVVFPYLNEKSICTTRATSGFLLALLWWCLEKWQRGKGWEALAGLPQAGRAVVEEAERVTCAVAEAVAPRAAAFLGSGALYGLAREGALKTNEMALIPTAAFHTLEYRHGPRSLAAPDVLVTGLVAHRSEMMLLEEARGLGARTFAIGDAGREVEWSLPLECELGHLARLPLYLMGLQMLGLQLARARGLDPDAPRHLTRYVDLTGGQQ